MTDLRIVRTRGGLVESEHAVRVAIRAGSGGALATHGDVAAPVFWRSAAKPFQALAAVTDGAADQFGFDDAEVALACASHSSEPGHRATALAMLAKIGADETALACGPHTPLSPAVDALVRHDDVVMTPAWSNCSGKHAAMLALARVHGWPWPGYEQRDSRVQQRVLAEVAAWTGLEPSRIPQGVDGCNTVCTAIPLDRMAKAYGRLASATDGPAARIVTAMHGHPWHVAGTDRLCTDLMTAAGGRLIVKLGAEGVYCAGLMREGIGIALKVQDGSMATAGVALLGVLAALDAALGLDLGDALAQPAVARHGPGPIRNTKGLETGEQRLDGALRVSGPVLRAADAAPTA